MNLKVYSAIPGMLALALGLSGCAVFVGGDLGNSKSDYRMPICTGTPVYYQVIYKSDAKDDYGDQNVAGFISWCTLGIVPTYWKSTVHSEATILHDGGPVYTGKYTSRVHKFYGILWGLILPFESKSINALQADEGGGIRIEWGTRDRTLWKVVADYGGKEDQFCLLNGRSTNAPPNTALEPAAIAVAIESAARIGACGNIGRGSACGR
jgi:hypothetical protein